MHHADASSNAAREYVPPQASIISDVTNVSNATRPSKRVVASAATEGRGAPQSTPQPSWSPSTLERGGEPEQQPAMSRDEMSAKMRQLEVMMSQMQQMIAQWGQVMSQRQATQLPHPTNASAPKNEEGLMCMQLEMSRNLLHQQQELEQFQGAHAREKSLRPSVEGPAAEPPHPSHHGHDAGLTAYRGPSGENAYSSRLTPSKPLATGRPAFDQWEERSPSNVPSSRTPMQTAPITFATPGNNGDAHSNNSTWIPIAADADHHAKRGQTQTRSSVPLVSNDSAFDNFLPQSSVPTGVTGGDRGFSDSAFFNSANVNPGASEYRVRGGRMAALTDSPPYSPNALDGGSGMKWGAEPYPTAGVVPSARPAEGVQQWGSRRVPRGHPGSWQPKEDTIFIIVEFKRQRLKKYFSPFFASPGDYVIVEGDRGVDCGFVAHSYEYSAKEERIVRSESIDGKLSGSQPGVVEGSDGKVDVSRMGGSGLKVLRLATEEEVNRLHSDIANEERGALHACRLLAAKMGLDMEVVDCEYQFDKRKISFYFEASHSVDFRELNVELFRMFGVRIWLENVNSKVKNIVPTGALSQVDKMHYARSGLRPPRRGK